MIRTIKVEGKEIPLAITQGALFTFAKEQKCTLKEALEIIEQIPTLDVTPEVIESFLTSVFREGAKLSGQNIDHITPEWVNDLISKEVLNTVTAETQQSISTSLSKDETVDSSPDEQKKTI